MTQWDSVEIDPRAATPMRRVDVYLALAVTTLTCVVYVVALSIDVLPSRGLAVAFFAAAPICAVFALLVLAVRARAESDAMLGWFASGLAVTFVAMLLQLISYPLVTRAGGFLRTSDDGSAGLYLLFHLALFGGALAGALDARARWQLPAVIVGVSLAFLVAIDAVPLPDLLRSDGTFTPLLIVVEFLLAGLVAVAMALWVYRSGRSASALRGWVGVALLLAVYELLINALAGERFGSVWWASLSLRVATFLVLAAGSIIAVLWALRDQESYTHEELERREGQLRRSNRITSQLLAYAEDLAEAVTPAEVGKVLCSDALRHTGMAHAAIALVTDGGRRLELLASAQYDEMARPQIQHIDGGERLPEPEELLASGPVFLTSREEIRARFPTIAEWRSRPAVAMAVLPIRVGDTTTGVLLVWGPEPKWWIPLQQDLLNGLVTQGGQAIARARAYAAERDAALTLQESLLPARLPRPRGLRLAARYVPGERGLVVGGDWYDCVEIDEHRVALIVGDVMGKGLRAATQMGQIRTTVRALATVDPSPEAVLNALDGQSIGLEDGRIATLVYVLLDIAAGTAQVARAGHLPPLLVSTDGVGTFVYEGGSPPLGVSIGARPAVTVPFPPGSMLVLYTDGAVEDRQHGLDRLADLVTTAERIGAQLRPDVESFVTALLDQINTEDRPDDVALLVAEFSGVDALLSPQPREWA